MLRLTSMAQDEDNRPRANAIQALMNLKFKDAIGALVSMLNAPRPEHRFSALWLVREMALVDMASHVAKLSISDPDRSVKNRAGQVVTHLIELLSVVTRDQPQAKAARATPQSAAVADQHVAPVLHVMPKQTEANV